MKYDVVIVGSGAAGLSAALYAKRYALSCLVVEGEFGGETLVAGTIENYPGVPLVDGYDLVNAMAKQAEAVGAEIKEGWATEIKKDFSGFIVVVDNQDIKANSVILAIGSQRKHLNLSNEKELTSRGVHYCWTCDGPLYKDKTIAMVGGGDSSVKGINFLCGYAKKIYFIVQANEVHAEPVNFSRMKSYGEKVEILLGTEVKQLVGDKKLEKLVLSKEYQGTKELIVDGFFIEIGFEPNRLFANQLGLEVDAKGYMVVDHMMRTSVPGIFVAGDSTNFFEGFKQDITAAALGAVAATSAYAYCEMQKANA